MCKEEKVYEVIICELETVGRSHYQDTEDQNREVGASLPSTTRREKSVEGGNKECEYLKWLTPRILDTKWIVHCLHDSMGCVGLHGLCGSPWAVVGLHGLWWVSMGCVDLHGLCGSPWAVWVSMGCGGSPWAVWVSMGCGESPWAV